MKSRRFLAKKMNIFYEEVDEKGKGKQIRLQTDQEFLQNEFKRLNKKHNVDMFTTKIRGDKTFFVEEKICKLKKGYLR